MKFYYKTLAFASLLALAACSDFDEMNTNPYEPPYSPGTSNTDVSPEGIDIDYELPEADIKALKEAETSIGSLFRNLTNEGPYNDYQVTTNLTHDIYAGYMANTSAGFHEKASIATVITSFSFSPVQTFVGFDVGDSFIQQFEHSIVHILLAGI